jgi:uncharacterized protein (TIGR00369 family)
MLRFSRAIVVSITSRVVNTIRILTPGVAVGKVSTNHRTGALVARGLADERHKSAVPKILLNQYFILGETIASASEMSTINQEYPAFASLEQSPFSKILGLKVESASAGAAVVRMPFDLRLLNDGGPDVPIHGGAIASLADFAACAAVWTMPETQRSATITMTVNYTAPGIRSDLVARARVRSKGRRVASIAVEIHDRNGALVADALVSYKIA